MQVNAAQVSINAAMLHMMLSLKPTLFKMHSAQAFAIWALGFNIRSQVPEFKSIALDSLNALSVGGIHCETDDTLNAATVQCFNEKHEMLCSLENLSVPSTYHDIYK
jgi:hypothetical protein